MAVEAVRFHEREHGVNELTLESVEIHFMSFLAERVQRPNDAGGPDSGKEETAPRRV